MTKMLEVTIKLTIYAPDDWELHQTSTGAEVIKLPDGRYMDLTYVPMVADDPEQDWTTEGTDDLLDVLIDVTEEDVSFVFLPEQ